MGKKLKLLIPPIYEDESDFKEGFAGVQLGEYWGLINKKGKKISDFKYRAVNSFSEGLAAVCDKNWKYGFINTKGKLIIEHKYLYPTEFNNGLAVVKDYEEEELMVINATGNEMKFDDRYYMLNVSDGLIIGKIKDDLGGGIEVLDKTGKLIFEKNFEYLSTFSEGLAHFKAEGKYGFINKSGEVVIRPQFKSCENFKEGMAYVELDNYKKSFINKEGELINEEGWSYCGRNFSEGLCWFKNYDEYDNLTESGFLNTKGEMQIEYYFNDSADASFTEGLAAVAFENGNYGYINTKGETVIAPDYSLLRNFSEGLAGVVVDDKWGYCKNPIK